MTSELHKHWNRMNDLLRLIASNTGCSVEGHQEFHDYLEHNELGLAFELLVGGIEKGGEPISSETYAAIEEAGVAMKFDPAIWKSLAVDD